LHTPWTDWLNDTAKYISRILGLFGHTATFAVQCETDIRLALQPHMSAASR
jgi:hypothetical protein